MSKKSLVGTELERKKVQVRLLVKEIEVIKKNDFFGFKDLSKFISGTIAEKLGSKFW